MSLKIDEEIIPQKKKMTLITQSLNQMGILLVLSLIGIFILFIILFIIIRNIQGSPYSVDWSGFLTLSEQEMFRSLNDLWGLDKNPIQQFFIFLGNMITGNWGETSWGESVKEIIMRGYPLSLKLNLLSLGFSLIPGLIFGFLADKFKNKKYRLIFQAIKRLIWIIPIFIIGLFLVRFARTLGWYAEDWGIWPPLVPNLKFKYLIMPAICQSFIFFSFIADLTYSIINFFKKPKEMHFLSGKICAYLSFILVSDMLIERLFRIYYNLGFGWLAYGSHSSFDSVDIFFLSAKLTCIFLTFFIINISLNFLLHMIRIIMELRKNSKIDKEMNELTKISSKTTEIISESTLKKDTLLISDNDENKKSICKEVFMILRFKLYNPLTILGILFILIVLILSIFAKWISPYDYDLITILDFSTSYAPPSSEFIFGANYFGTDVFSRCLYGIQTAVKVGIISTLIGMPLGVIIGTLSAFFGKWITYIIDILNGMLLFIPGVIFAAFIFSIRGYDLRYFYWIFGLINLPIATFFTQQVVSYEMKRGDIKQLKFSKPNVKKFQDRLPNIILSILSVGCLIMGLTIFNFEILNYVVVDVKEIVSLGGDVFIARGTIGHASWASLWPAFWIYIIVSGFIMLGIGLKE